VALQDLHIWHYLFGMPGAHNKLNVLDSSPLFNNLLHGDTPTCEFVVNGKTYHQGYYLSNGIYPDWSTLMKTISQPQGLQQKVCFFLEFM
jgi:hypothetical protein